MYKYKIDKSYDKIPLEINIETVPINDKGVGEVLSINLDSYYKINRAKNRITEINSNQWDEVKKITNPYEFIHTFNSKTKRALEQFKLKYNSSSLPTRENLLPSETSLRRNSRKNRKTRRRSRKYA